MILTSTSVPVTHATLMVTVLTDQTPTPVNVEPTSLAASARRWLDSATLTPVVLTLSVWSNLQVNHRILHV